MLNTSIRPDGHFRVGRHTPAYRVANLRERDLHGSLGQLADGTDVANAANFPEADVTVDRARTIYEIPNPFPFRGCTYIDSGWADARAADPGSICIPPPPQLSLREMIGRHCPDAAIQEIVTQLPMPLRYQLAVSSTDPVELTWLAHSCCRFVLAADNTPAGLRYLQRNERTRPDIDDFELFETIANNPHLPDSYKEAMVLRPGAQGGSEIVGDYCRGTTEIFEYLRGNSYIPWGHYAANCAPASIRYRIADLSPEDMAGLRHLYYQRVFMVLADKLGMAPEVRRRRLSAEELESLRQEIVKCLADGADPEAIATLWGWNFGYDFSGSGYRLHASHQMIHQQYALVPQWVAEADGSVFPAYCCGDLVADVIARYRQDYHSDFFNDYLLTLANNTRTDGHAGTRSLVVWEDERVVLFVPKAQVSQWELQLLVKADWAGGPVGNVVEADASVRDSLDLGILTAQQVLARLGATMVTSIEYAKRLGTANGQRLLYAFLPKLPWSMGAFSEAQGRCILGHYPEDFAEACRRQLD
ncbi:MAG: hypothetical protein LBD10_06815 [Desulfobulbus sp.]|jgi:hypothetical protein|uniref:hypothetical protein n=1 Tax=Desulfobulbus sp. TaxID=895 RepID=UPI00284FE94B|nr:hypothetical protein [Desulfobulbus sp.]MDR2549890.1 hypothetical protein [Desulfobulbus sp.]